MFIQFSMISYNQIIWDLVIDSLIQLIFFRFWPLLKMYFQYVYFYTCTRFHGYIWLYVWRHFHVFRDFHSDISCACTFLCMFLTSSPWVCVFTARTRSPLLPWPLLVILDGALQKTWCERETSWAEHAGSRGRTSLWFTVHEHELTWMSL